MTELNPDCCRVCLKSVPKLHSIEHVNFDSVSALHALTTLLQLKITKMELNASHLPNKLCTQCMKKLGMFVRFWNVSQYSESRIDAWKLNNREEMMKIFLSLSSDEEDSGVSEISSANKSYGQTIDDDSSSNDDEDGTANKKIILKKIYGKMIRNQEPKSFQLNEKDKEELLKEFFEIPVEEEMGDQEENFTCGTCAHSFPTKSSVVEHINQCHYDNLNLMEDGADGKSWKVMGLVVPAKFTRNLRPRPVLTPKIFDHSVDGRPRLRAFQCRVCDRSYFSETYLRPHVCVPAGNSLPAVKASTARTIDRNFECGICGLNFARISSLRGHIKITHAPICY